MSHVSDFTQDEDKIILDLVNEDNNTEFTLDELTLSVASKPAEKSVLTLTPKVGTGYNGNVTVSYDRIKIDELVDLYRPNGVVVQQGEAVNLSGFLSELNALLGTAIKADGIVDRVIGAWQGTPNETKDIVFEMRPANRVYEGSFILTVDGNDIELSSIITNKVLHGLHLPGYVDGVNYQPTIDAMVYPFQANTTETPAVVLSNLTRYLELSEGDLSFGPGAVFPSFDEPVKEVTLVSNNPEVNFNGRSSTTVELGLGRIDIPNTDLANYIENGAQWTRDATRGWYNDVNSNEENLNAYSPAIGLQHLEPRLKRMGARFTSLPLSASNGLGMNVIAFFEEGVWPPVRIGLHDPYNGQANQAIYDNSATPSYEPGDRVLIHYFRDFAPPGERPATDIRFGSAFRPTYNKTQRGVRDVYMEFYVTKAPDEVITYLNAPLLGTLHDLSGKARYEHAGFPSNFPSYETIDGQSTLRITSGRGVTFFPKEGQPDFLSYPEWNLTFEVRMINPTAVKHEAILCLRDSEDMAGYKIYFWKRNQTGNRVIVGSDKNRNELAPILADGGAMGANVWRKFSVRRVKEDNVLRLYINDVLTSQVVNTDSFAGDVLQVMNVVSANFFNGYIRNIRITDK